MQTCKFLVNYSFLFLELSTWSYKNKTYCPSLKYSFNVLLNRFENLTNSRLRCSKACFPVLPGMNPATSFTASSSFLIALAISL